MDTEIQKTFNLLNFGIAEYQRAWSLQKQLFFLRRCNQISDVLILLEHPPVITVGKRGNEKNILASKEILREEKISVFKIERGGDVTYHGPGQLVGYPIMNIKNHGLSISKYIFKLEESLICTIEKFGVAAERREKYRGVFVGNRKIASIGIKVSGGVTMHGFALNVSTNLRHFKLIKPCGLSDIEMDSLENLTLKRISTKDVRRRYSLCFERIFEVKLRESNLKEILSSSISLQSSPRTGS
ncbi:MAG: lipoyl(octanoyl) transferase LipB [Candidatus Methanofastidiosia archaeon]